jgi:aromatic-L-amino-acid/L-tryptophan decarboxylase
MNPSVAGGNHAAVHLERQVVRWFADLLGWAGGHAGQLVSGGSAATLTALAAARRRALTRAGLDDRRDGVSAAAGVPAVYATAEAHSCAIKAVEILGIGSARIAVIVTGPDRTMDPADLRRRLTADRAAGKLPIAVVASAGTVNTRGRRSAGGRRRGVRRARRPVSDCSAPLMPLNCGFTSRTCP